MRVTFSACIGDRSVVRHDHARTRSQSKTPTRVGFTGRAIEHIPVIGPIDPRVYRNSENSPSLGARDPFSPGDDDPNRRPSSFCVTSSEQHRMRCVRLSVTVIYESRARIDLCFVRTFFAYGNTAQRYEMCALYAPYDERLVRKRVSIGIRKRIFNRTLYSAVAAT